MSRGMATIKHYWSFKQVLKGSGFDDDAQALEDGHTDDGLHKDGPIGSPSSEQPAMRNVFVANSQGASRQGLEMLSELMEPFLQDRVQPKSPLKAQQTTAKAVRSDMRIPKPAELARLNVPELRALRRQLALHFHPDRLAAIGATSDSEAMRNCNQLIDAAIAEKSKVRPA